MLIEKNNFYDIKKINDMKEQNDQIKFELEKYKINISYENKKQELSNKNYLNEINNKELTKSQGTFFIYPKNSNYLFSTTF